MDDIVLTKWWGLDGNGMFILAFGCDLSGRVYWERLGPASEQQGFGYVAELVADTSFTVTEIRGSFIPGATAGSCAWSIDGDGILEMIMDSNTVTIAPQ